MTTRGHIHLPGDWHFPAEWRLPADWAESDLVSVLIFVGSLGMIFLGALTVAALVPWT